VPARWFATAARAIARSVHAVVVVEAAVLGGDDRVDEDLGQLVALDRSRLA
jgi:hypothetical protein